MIRPGYALRSVTFLRSQIKLFLMRNIPVAPHPPRGRFAAAAECAYKTCAKGRGNGAFASAAAAGARPRENAMLTAGAGRDDPEGRDTLPFGFRDVPAAEKQPLVNGVFARVARRYDRMNDLMSAGLHRLWKEDFVTAINPPRGEGAFCVLDMAGGTGDVALRVLRRGGPGVRVTLADISPEMIAEARRRAAADRAGGPAERLRFAVANAEALPFPDNHFDVYAIAFGIRNVARPEKALREARRVLRPGGRFLCLEFSKMAIPGLARLYEAYSFAVIPALGKVVTGDGRPYRYLAESIRRFPAQEAFLEMIRDAGFGRASFRNMAGGAVAMHSGWKI